MDIVIQFADTKDQMNVILNSILEFAIKQPVFGDQYARLCQYLYEHLADITTECDHEWILNHNLYIYYYHTLNHHHNILLHLLYQNHLCDV